MEAREVRYILDTNVLSELMKEQPDQQVMEWFARHKHISFATTAINEAELITGYALLPSGRKKTQLQREARAVLEEDLNNNVMPFNSNAAKELALVLERRRDAGRPIHFQDACIAAIAKSLSLPVVTRDVGGFEGTGIEIFNPWEDLTDLALPGSSAPH
jgi:predicted nucleic acid-binding protein